MKVTRLHLENIAEAQRFYEGRGFENVDVEWEVPKPYIDATLPSGAIPLHNMVGSGEQSMLAKFDPDWERQKEGLFQCVTPCFRPSDRGRSEYHLGEFLKLELMMIPDGQPSFPELFVYVITPVLGFLKGAPKSVTKMSETSWDILGYKNGAWVEVGSYGWRTIQLPFGLRTWYYGTGIAEPRFSQVFG